MSLMSANMRPGDALTSAECLDLPHGKDSHGYNRRPQRLAMPMAKADAESRPIAENRKARFDYFIEERMEAGIVAAGLGSEGDARRSRAAQ